MSFGVPLRPSGTFDERFVVIGPISPLSDGFFGQKCSISPACIRSSVGTGTTPGLTAFTRIPCGDRSTARLRVK